MTAPSPTAPDTSIPDTDDETQDDPTDPTGLPPDDNDTPDQPFTLSPQMAASAGVGDLKVGDTFAITIHGTVTDSTDGTITADIEDAMDGIKTPGDASAKPAKKPPQSRVVGPKEAGFQDEAGNSMM